MPLMYKAVEKIVDKRIPIPYHECGVPPNPDKSLKDGVVWSWWMEWHTSFIRKVDTTYLKYVYNHTLIVTRDKVPDIIRLYGKKK